MPGQRAAPLSSAQVAKGAEAEAIGSAGRDHDTVERRQQGRIGSHIRCETEYDALFLAGRRHVVDVARKACVARLDLLEQRRLAGIAEAAAGALGLLEHRHRVAVGDQRRVGEAGGPGADHGDAFAARRLCIGE